MIYAASYDVSALTLGTLTLTTAGKTDRSVTLSSITALSGATGVYSSLFSHGVGMGTFVSQGQRGAARLQTYSLTSYAAALQAAIQAAITVATSWTSPSGFTVTWSNTTGKFTFAYASANFTMAWSVAAGRNFCGFSGSQSGASSYTSDQVPTYVIVPTLTKTSGPAQNYEPDGIASLAVADDGSGFGIARYESMLYRDWIQQYEEKARVMRLSAASSHPWTTQDMFEHCRTVFPFVVVDGFNDDSYYECFRFRADGCAHKPEPASPNEDTRYHVPFKCLVEGRVAE